MLANEMKLTSIETTPSPNSIKLNLSQVVSGNALTLQQGTNSAEAPAFAQKLLAIAGIQSVFLFKDFITLTRKGNADWQPILAEAAHTIGVAENADAKLLAQVSQAPVATSASGSTPPSSLPTIGSVEVAIQKFRGIPVQVRATADDGQQARVALPGRFNEALQRAIQATGADYIAERRWEPYQAPPGLPDEVAHLVAEEIVTLIDENELARIEAEAIANASDTAPLNPAARQQKLLAELHHPDWKHRLKALQQIEVNPETFTTLVARLDDSQSAIRRWAAALLGASGMADAIAPLSRVVLEDPSAIVRRTAADALNDLGDSRAIPTLIQALSDSSKLVRWRAARFLSELGDESAIDALRGAIEQEAEFDVRIEMMAALERIEGGGDAQLPMWMRITQGGSSAGEVGTQV